MRIEMSDKEYRSIQGSIAELIATNRSLRNNCKRYERMLKAYRLKDNLKRNTINSQLETIQNLRIRINELENTIEKLQNNG